MGPPKDVCSHCDTRNFHCNVLDYYGMSANGYHLVLQQVKNGRMTDEQIKARSGKTPDEWRDYVDKLLINAPALSVYEPEGTREQGQIFCAAKNVKSSGWAEVAKSQRERCKSNYSSRG